MHYPPDLTLASSYLPACMCMLKSGCAFILFVVSPVRGWIGLCSLMVVDRILWNQNTYILDVNAVASALVGALMVMHARGDGVHSMVQLAVVVLWATASAIQIVGAVRIHRQYEIMLAACCVTILSCFYQEQERVELEALRVMAFVVLNVALPYLGVLTQKPDVDTCVNICRTLLLLLGEPEQALGWVAVYLLCIGYQLRGTTTTTKQPASLPASPSSLVVTAPPPPSIVVEDEAAVLLREALAFRKGFQPT